MRRILFLAALALFSPSVSAAQMSATPACRPGAQGRVDVQACANAAPAGSPERSLSLINLGTAAFQQGDYAVAVRLYDEAVPNGQQVFSDPRFHAFRGAAYERVGREKEALADARVAWAGLPRRPQEVRTAEAQEVLPHILPVLKRGSDPAFGPALAAYRALPATDWIDHANRAGVLIQLGDASGALAANDEALRLQPEHPAVLNNACYILTKAARPAEGRPFCERAIAAAPDAAPVRDSYATNLAALGLCTEANSQLARARALDAVTLEYQRKLECIAR